MTYPKKAARPSPETEAVGAENREQSQQRRLEKINAELARYKLVPFAQLGTWQRGEFEILDVVSVAANAWYAIVEFSVTRPDGRQGVYFMKFAVQGAERRGCAIVVMIEDQLVFVRQHRPTLLIREESPWINEIPREWSVAGATQTIVDRLLKSAPSDPGHTLPLGVLGHELAPLVVSGVLRSEGMVLLGDGPEDTGMSTVIVDYWLLRFRLAEGASLGKLRGTKSMGIRTYPLDEVMKRRKELGMVDSHTLTGLLMLYEHLGRIR